MPCFIGCIHSTFQKLMSFLPKDAPIAQVTQKVEGSITFHLCT